MAAFIENLAGLNLDEIKQRFKDLPEDALVDHNLSQNGAIYVLGYLLEQEEVQRMTVRQLRESLLKIKRVLGQVADERGIALEESGG